MDDIANLNTPKLISLLRGTLLAVDFFSETSPNGQRFESLKRCLVEAIEHLEDVPKPN